MNIVLINAPWINNEIEYGVKSGARWAMVRKKDRTMPFYAFPFYLAYAASYLSSKGFNAYLRDSIALEETKEEALSFVKSCNADLVIIETSTPSISYDIEFCDEVKKLNPNIIVALTGPHATALPEEVLENSLCNYVLIGEYDSSLLELAIKIRDKKDTLSIKGLAYRTGSKTVVNERCELIKDLDALPFPIRDKAIIHKLTANETTFFKTIKKLLLRSPVIF